jgi:hypothetical protein
MSTCFIRDQRMICISFHYFFSLLLILFLKVQIIDVVKKKCPRTPLVLYINGNGGLLERMKGTGVDVIGLDWTVDMEDGRKRLGKEISVEGNVDPAYLFSPLPALTEEIQRFVTIVSDQISITCNSFCPIIDLGLSLICLCACHGLSCFVIY